MSSRNLSSLARTRFAPCERPVSALSVCADRQARRCESWRGTDSRIESELRIETKLLMIGTICRNVVAASQEGTGQLTPQRVGASVPKYAVG